MTNEFTMDFALNLTNGNLVEQLDISNYQDDQAAAGIQKMLADISTSDETVDTGDLSAPRWCFARNLDDTNYVSLGPDSTGIVELIRLQPDDWCLFPLAPGVALHAQANTAACKVLFVLFET